MDKLTVTTFNIRVDCKRDGQNNWEHRFSLVRDFLKRERLDIICFQEVLPDVKEQLKELLKDTHDCFGCGRTAALDGEAMLIAFDKNRFELVDLNNFWLSESPHVLGSKFSYSSYHPRLCSVMTLKTKEGFQLLRVFNTHLDNVSEKARESGLKLVLNKIAEFDKILPCPVLLCGDFNAEPDFVLPMIAKSSVPLYDFSDISKNSVNFTYHGFYKEEKVKIDYIFGSKEFELVSSRLITNKDGEVCLSDHHAVIAELRLRQS